MFLKFSWRLKSMNKHLRNLKYESFWKSGPTIPDFPYLLVNYKRSDVEYHNHITCGINVSPTVIPATKSPIAQLPLYFGNQYKIGSRLYSIFLVNVPCTFFLTLDPINLRSSQKFIFSLVVQSTTVNKNILFIYYFYFLRIKFVFNLRNIQHFKI